MRIKYAHRQSKGRFKREIEMDKKEYKVTATLKYQSCYDSGREFTVKAESKSDAIRRAKLSGDNDFSRQDGPVYWKAEEVTAY